MVCVLLGGLGTLVPGVFFLDPGGLTAEFTQVVELCPADTAAADDVNVIDDRCVKREDTLDADAEAHLADRHGLAGTAVLAGNHNALKDLDTLLVTFLDADVYLDGVAGLKGRDVVPELRFLYCI